jgi:hypothetical protein
MKITFADLRKKWQETHLSRVRRKKYSFILAHRQRARLKNRTCPASRDSNGLDRAKSNNAKILAALDKANDSRLRRRVAEQLRARA